jgi:hypothetical protein
MNMDETTHKQRTFVSIALAATMLGLILMACGRMPRRWLFLPIDPGNVKVVTFQLLYSRSTAPMAFDAYLAAEQGDPSGLALMSLLGLSPTGITWGAFFPRPLAWITTRHATIWPIWIHRVRSSARPSR